MNKLYAILPFMLLFGCATYAPKTDTQGEQKSGYTYIPVDPFPVEFMPGLDCPTSGKIPYQKLPKGLPDNAVRVLVEQFDGKGKVSYGPGSTEATNQVYRVTTDFISADTINIPFIMAKMAIRIDTGRYEPIPFEQQPDSLFRPNSEVYQVKRITSASTVDENDFTRIFNIPVYVGIGLRATADIVTTSAKANVTGLGVIGAEAELGNLKGSLVVQTLGVNGKAVTAALPIQSELNRTTAQNAIVAVASIKTLLHSTETDIAPRVVGLYLPFSGGRAIVNALISELSTTPPIWRRPCESTDNGVAAKSN